MDKKGRAINSWFDSLKTNTSRGNEPSVPTTFHQVVVPSEAWGSYRKIIVFGTSRGPGESFENYKKGNVRSREV
jgi:hypothetical protein